MSFVNELVNNLVEDLHNNTTTNKCQFLYYTFSFDVKICSILIHDYCLKYNKKLPEKINAYNLDYKTILVLFDEGINLPDNKNVKIFKITTCEKNTYQEEDFNFRFTIFNRALDTFYPELENPLKEKIIQYMEPILRDSYQSKCIGIETPTQNSNILFSMIPQVTQKFLQAKLNAKHGKLSMSTNEMIFQNTRECQICFFIKQPLEKKNVFFLQKLKHGEQYYYFYLFVTTDQTQLDNFSNTIPTSNWYFTNARSQFKDKNLFLVNFIRLYFFNYTQELIVTNNLLAYTLFLLGNLCWCCGSLNRQALKKIYNNPILSLFSGGVLEHLKQPSSDYKNISTLLDHPIINRMYKVPINTGSSDEHRINITLSV
jgi:hypothetical protein